MQKFWYHSPVRFYKTLEELQDMTNPQNTQYFGGNNPYPLEINTLHRFLIPNVDNEVDSDELEMWVGNNRIACEFGIANGKLYRVTLLNDSFISGNIQIRKSTGEILFYSNCISFVNSTDSDGRKYIRVATKSYYNKNLFDYNESDFEWMITNLPGYCLGQFIIDSEYNTARTGDNNGLIIQDSFTDEVVSYQFIGDGDSNILTFIQAHALNDSFYIDGTKRTIKEQPEVDSLSTFGTFKFVNQKDKRGLNIILNEDEIFGDVLVKVLGVKNQSLIYVYDNETVIPT